MSWRENQADYDVFAPTVAQAQAAKLSESELSAIGLTKEDAASFQALRKRYLHKKPVNWDGISAPEQSFYVDFASLPTSSEDKEVTDLLSKVVVLKLNGGLGTSMGCKGPKSTIEVSHGLSFLDLTVTHIQNLNNKYKVDLPLVLMNSFNTDAETKKTVLKYEGSNVSITNFQQSKFPRMYKDTLNLVPKASAPFNGKDWYPPGSGNVFASFKNSGLLDKFIAEGKEYLFISNVESIGATVDIKILKHVLGKAVDFAIEVTDRISTDVTGGMLVKYEDKVHLMEMSQVPHNRSNQFKALTYKYWNTNNLWVNLKTVRTLFETTSLDLDFVVNVVNGGRELQIETPAGMAIQNFANSIAIHVPRTRYRPVKSTNQLLLIQSNIFNYKDGLMTMNEKREPATVPLIKLGEEFKEVPDYLKRFKTIPNILELEHLTVSGDVWFGADITLKGTVIIVANHGERIDIPDGVVLENKIISGNLRLVEH